MLIYRKRESSESESTTTSIADADENELIPADLRAEILADNVKVELMSRVYEARTKIARITVCRGSRDFETIELLKTATLSDATREAVRALIPSQTQNEKTATANYEYRLRVFEPRASRPGRTFGETK